MQSFLSGQLENYYLVQRLKRVAYWWIELKEGIIKRKVPFDILKSPITGLEKISIDLKEQDLSKYEEIQLELFEDLLGIYSKRDFNKLVKTHNKYLESWRITIKTPAPVFPILIINPKLPSGYLLIENANRLLGDSDLTGYEWDSGDIVIDKLGRIYKVEYLNFGHPMGVVIPKSIIEGMTKKEVKEFINSENIPFEIE
ncbi:hypothetical protein MYP_3576 [Sporocytophaga myxococcoides]|uniref:Uncharacterized protein n=1 Tax=Sporocytophaga myxococcoides TaxID=153721 RepID=A0A098LIZ2_9BACT|nr:hypothetical protein MYP_3576 [Sporocytophaga myxococcoides]